MRILFMSGMYILLSLVLSGCAAKEPAEVLAPTIEAQIKPGIEVRPNWQEEWEQLVKEAKNEGTAVIYAGFGGSERIALTESFKQKYGISLDITQGRGGEMAEKVIREKRAGLNLADVIISGASSLTITIKPTGLLGPLEPLLLLPEVKDRQVWWDKELPFLDKEKMIFTFIAYVVAPITINTDMVKAAELSSMRDILNPRWKGKIAMNDPTLVGAGLSWFSAFGELLDYDFMRALAKMDPVITADRRLLVEWIAKGKHPLGLAVTDQEVTDFIRLGAPLSRIIPQEGTWVSAGAGVVSVPAEASHPNAAKLFINWLLSREGQTIYSKAQGSPSNRVDVPTDHLLPISLRQPGVRYLATEGEQFLLSMPEKQKIAREIFGPLMK